MNERIKELAEQADISVRRHYDETGSTYAELQKFAELIVRECAEVAEDYDGAHYVGTAIKQYFGVKA